jgi:undecaprenyl-diphosphatase
MDTFLIYSAQYLFVLPTLMLGVFFVTRRWPAQKSMAIFAVPAGLFAYALGLLGNFFYYDPRPFVVEHFVSLIPHVPDNGFPSDHTLLAAVLASVAMYWDKWLGAALWAIAILIAVARVYVGLHHPIDVFGSIGIALIAVGLWSTLLNNIWCRQNADGAQLQWP